MALLALAVTGSGAAAQSTRDRVAAASAYVERLEAALPSMVGDERYVQEAVTAAGADPPEASRRVLESEFAWVRLPGVDETVGVRDVRTIDGRASSDGSRLRALLEHPPPEPLQEIRAILAESARHNLGPDQRNFNFPTFPLVYLRADRARRLSWRSTMRDGRVELRFTEPDRGTVVHTAEGRPVAARGRFLVDAASGRVERAELQLKEVRLGSGTQPRLTYDIAVIFSDDARLGLWLPASMNDTYDRKFSARERLTVEGQATYDNYRRYEGSGRLVQ